jgi:hypothetical protein
MKEFEIIKVEKVDDDFLREIIERSVRQIPFLQCRLGNSPHNQTTMAGAEKPLLRGVRQTFRHLSRWKSFY